MAEKSVLVVDDEVKITEVIASYLERGGYRVFKAFNGTDCLALFEEHTPSLVVLDLMLPDIPGEELCKRIRKKSRIPILMLTAKVQEEDLLSGFSIGADDYMTKPFSPRELVARVEALFRRSSAAALTSELSFNGGDLVINVTNCEVVKAGQPMKLTPNEFKILKALSSWPEKVFSREQLIREAFNHDFEGYERTIDTHIKNLRQKIETDYKHPLYIKTVFGMGYKFAGGL